ncbi:hypothetical protein OPQ81_003023 [Rhizoctonia solani]|nr:hypothetical protein OPQ81_003023 [Rhizoctonia solani]
MIARVLRHQVTCSNRYKQFPPTCQIFLLLRQGSNFLEIRTIGQSRNSGEWWRASLLRGISKCYALLQYSARENFTIRATQRFSCATLMHKAKVVSELVAGGEPPDTHRD